MTNNADNIYVEKKIAKILRGNQQDLPKCEPWQYNDLVKGRYYLLTYWNYKVPLQTAAWAGYYNVEQANNTFVVKRIKDNQTHGFYDQNAVYSDLPLEDLENLLKETPYESNPTNTFFYQAGHPKK